MKFKRPKERENTQSRTIVSLSLGEAKQNLQAGSTIYLYLRNDPLKLYQYLRKCLLQRQNYRRILLGGKRIDIESSDYTEATSEEYAIFQAAGISASESGLCMAWTCTTGKLCMGEKMIERHQRKTLAEL